MLRLRLITPVRGSRCSTLSSEKTESPSIQAHGGQQAKSKRFADDAQNFPSTSWCSGRRSPDAHLHTAPNRVQRFERESGGGRHLSATQFVRRRVRACSRGLRRET